MNRMQQMADSLNQCKQCLQEGQGGQAAEGLGQLAESLEQLQDAMDQLETLDQIMDDIAMAKDAMGCEACDGRGCEACMGGAFGWQQGQGDGQGMGEGQGFGERPEEQTDTRFYESQVRGEVRQGAAVVTGTVGGPNRAGRSLVETREVISGAMSEDPDPLIDLRLPKTERDHTRQYFESLRDGR
jgi:X-X-X-Leu-X-X-Gly heptad repeat protein